MDIKNVQQELETQHFFQVWKQKHSNTYLTHFFITSENEVQLGYYDAQVDTIWTFTPGQELITEDKEIFKKEKIIPKLELSDIKISATEAQQKAVQFQKEKYPGDPISKQIIVLQSIENRAVYNMTLVTMTFKVLNLRIDATTGEIISEKMQPIMNLVQTFENKKQKGENV